MKNKPLYILLLTIFIDLLGFSIIIPILPVYSKELGATNIMVGIIAGSYALMNFIFSPIWGNLSDRIGRKPVILVSILITAFSYLLFSFATAIPLLIVSRIIAGIGSANIGAAQAYITDITKPEDRTKAFGKIGAAFGLGFIIGPLIGGVILKHLGVQYIGYITMGLNIFNFILAAFILKESNKDKKKDKPLFENPLKSVLDGIKRPVLGKLMLISLLFITAFSMMQITISVYWNEKYALNKAQISDMFAFIGLATVLVQGFLVEKLNRRFGEYKLLVIGCLLMAIGLYLLPTAPYERWFYVVEGIAILFIALANGCISPSIQSLLSKNAGEQEQGKILGVSMSVSSLGRVFGPYLGGLFYGMAQFMPYFMGALIMVAAWRVAKRFVVKYGKPHLIS